MPDRDRDAIIAGLIAGAIMALFALCLLGINLIGRDVGYRKAWHDLPLCQEDEYLYPVDDEGRADYDGPGAAQPDDYGCFHFDG